MNGTFEYFQSFEKERRAIVQHNMDMSPCDIIWLPSDNEWIREQMTIRKNFFCNK